MGSVAVSPSSKRLCVALSSRPTTQTPARRSRSMAVGRPDTTAMGTCSMAPAAAFAAVGVMWTARWRGRTIPVPEDRAQVARIGHPVDEDEERRSLRRPAGEVVEVGLLEGRGLGQHTLGRLAPGLGVEALAADVLHGHPQVGGEREEVGRAAVTVLGGDPQLPHLASPGQEQLPDGLPSLDLVAAQAPR